MSVKVMARVWAHSQHEGGELLAMLALADFANDEGECWPSLEVLAQKARLTKRQTCKVLGKLEAAGEIRRERSTGGRNRRTRYFIVLNPTENSEIKTVKKEHCNNNSVFCDTKTVSYSSHALNRHRTVNKSKRPNGPHSLSIAKQKTNTRARPPADPRVQPFLSWFAEEYEKRFGVPYAPNYGKDGKRIKELPPAFDLPRLKDAAIRFLDSEDPWIREKGGFTVAVFMSQINRLASTANGNGRAKPPEVKELTDGWLEVDGMRISRKDYERRWKIESR